MIYRFKFNYLHRMRFVELLATDHNKSKTRDNKRP